MHRTSVQDLGRLRGQVINAYDIASSLYRRTDDEDLRAWLSLTIIDLQAASDRLDQTITRVNNAQS